MAAVPTLMVCPDCGHRFNPLCIGAALYHSGQCSRPVEVAKPKPWGRKSKQLWADLCKAEQRIKELEEALRKTAQEPLGRAEGFTGPIMGVRA